MTKETLWLISKAKKQDSKAFTEIMELYTQDMYKVALAILLNDQDVADAMQETILSCWEKIHTLRINQYFKTWMTKILINKCYDILNSRKNIVNIDDWEQVLTQKDYNYELKEAIKCLNEKYRLPIIMFYWQGYSAKEIAKILEIPVETVRTKIKRGRKQLSEYYDV